MISVFCPSRTTYNYQSFRVLLQRAEPDRFAADSDVQQEPQRQPRDEQRQVVAISSISVICPSRTTPNCQSFRVLLHRAEPDRFARRERQKAEAQETARRRAETGNHLFLYLHVLSFSLSVFHCTEENLTVLPAESDERQEPQRQPRDEKRQVVTCTASGQEFQRVRLSSSAA